MNRTSFVYIAAFLLSAGVSLAADYPSQPGDFFPRTRVAGGASQSDDKQLLAPLFTPEDQKRFDAAFSDVVHDAVQGTDADRRAAKELLLRKADRELGAGMQRYMLLQALELAKKIDNGTAEWEAVAAKILLLPDIDCIALAKLKADTLAATTRLAAPGNVRFTIENTANAFFHLAELYARADDIDNANKSIAEGEAWAGKEPIFAKSIKPVVEKFKAHLNGNAEVAAALKKDPNDPAANYKMAMKIIVQPDGLPKAEPYLSKTMLPELRHVAEAIRSKEPGQKRLLDLAAALINAMAQMQGEDRTTFAFLAYHQIQAVMNSPTATEAEKNRGEMLLIKVEGVVGAPQAQAISTQAVKQQVPPSAKFFGVETQGNRIVYIIDHSGSLLDNFDFLKAEVARSVDGLAGTQLFAVVAFSENVDILGPPAMQRATDVAKKDLGTRIKDIKAQGQNDDMLPPFQKAFETAFKLNPDTIYFLTDGAFDPKLFDIIRRLNPYHHAKISTMAFVQSDPRYEEQLKKLATENGGTYKFVSQKDLGR
jgi:hypothetical protein